MKARSWVGTDNWTALCRHGICSTRSKYAEADSPLPNSVPKEIFKIVHFNYLPPREDEKMAFGILNKRRDPSISFEMFLRDEC